MTLSKTLLRNSALAAGAAMIFAGLPAQAEHHEDGDDDHMELKQEAMLTLNQCRDIADTCAADIDAAAGVLVFPEVWKADLIIGGAGGEGLLFVDDEIRGKYDIGKASVGFQAGIDESSMVWVFREQESLDELMDGDEWEVGAAAGATVVNADANAMAATGDPRIYIIEAEGLNAELSVSALRIWEDDDYDYEDDFEPVDRDVDENDWGDDDDVDEADIEVYDDDEMN
ncbi:MAG: YSC84-related protein [Henriciella sp.]|uniref:YSC84-related protein n=1 Tax=Henriciella sp. TaxID=1968823 RepID=UPI003C728B4F